MALARFQRTLTDTTGNVRNGVSVTIRDESTGAIAALFSDKNGSSPKANPAVTDSDGFLEFYAASGRYRIQATGIDWRDEDLVTIDELSEAAEAAAAQATADAEAAQAAAEAAEDGAVDAQTAAESARDAAQLASGVFADTTAGLAGTSEGDYFSTPSGDGDEFLILYRHDAGPTATQIEVYPSVAGVQSTDLTGNPVDSSTGAAQALSAALDDRVINVDTTSDLQALPESDLVDGQSASVDGSIYKWSNGKWAFSGGRLVEPNREFTVGSGGDFASINDALVEISKQRPSFYESGLRIDVLLLSGFVMEEQVFISQGVDLSHIRIYSQDVEVTVSRESVTEKPTSEIFAPIFFAEKSSKLPVIDALFSFDGTGTPDGQSGVWIHTLSSGYIMPNAGVKNSVERGLHVSSGSTCNAEGSIWDNSGTIGVRVSNGSVCHFRNGFSRDCGENGIAVNAAYINCRGSDVSGGGLYGLFADVGSVASAYLLNATGCGDSGIQSFGGHVIAHNSDVSNSSGKGAVAQNGGFLSASNITANDCLDDAITANDGSIVICPMVTALNSGNNGLYAANGSEIHAPDATVTGADGQGVYSRSSSVIYAPGADATGSVGPGFFVFEGGVIHTNGSIGSIRADRPNIIEESGVIYDLARATENRGTAQVQSGSLSITVSHGLDYTPTIRGINLTPINNLGNSSKFWVGNITSSSFVIFVDSDPGSSGASFAWHAKITV